MCYSEHLPQSPPHFTVSRLALRPFTSKLIPIAFIGPIGCLEQTGQPRLHFIGSRLTPPTFPSKLIPLALSLPTGYLEHLQLWGGHSFRLLQGHVGPSLCTVGPKEHSALNPLTVAVRTHGP